MWRIYYADGSTFDWQQGPPPEAPPEGVLCIVAYDRHGRRYIAHRRDFYVFDQDSGEWWGVDLAGLLDRLRRNLVYAFKEGRSVDNAVFERAMQRAHEDPDFPLR